MKHPGFIYYDKFNEVSVLCACLMSCQSFIFKYLLKQDIYSLHHVNASSQNVQKYIIYVYNFLTPSLLFKTVSLFPDSFDNFRESPETNRRAYRNNSAKVGYFRQ